jgi:hypothetical protein
MAAARQKKISPRPVLIVKLGFAAKERVIIAVIVLNSPASA